MPDEATPSRVMSTSGALERHLDEGRANRKRLFHSYRSAPEVRDVACRIGVAFDMPVEDVQIAIPQQPSRLAAGGAAERDLAEVVQERENHFAEALLRRSADAQVDTQSASAFEACERLRDMSPEEIARLAAEGASEARTSIEATAEVWMHERKLAASKSGG